MPDVYVSRLEADRVRRRRRRPAPVPASELYTVTWKVPERGGRNEVQIVSYEMLGRRSELERLACPMSTYTASGRVWVGEDSGPPLSITLIERPLASACVGVEVMAPPASYFEQARGFYGE